MTKRTRLDVLFDAGIDYSRPINAFGNHAKRMFNALARKNYLKIRVYAVEYNDGGARLYTNHSGEDYLLRLAPMLEKFCTDLNYEFQKKVAPKLVKMRLEVGMVTFHGDEIFVEFEGDPYDTEV